MNPARVLIDVGTFSKTQFFDNLEADELTFVVGFEPEETAYTRH